MEKFEINKNEIIFLNKWCETLKYKKVVEVLTSLLSSLPYEQIELDLSSLGDSLFEKITCLRQGNWIKFYGGSDNGVLHWYSLWEENTKGLFTEEIFNANCYLTKRDRIFVFSLWRALMLYLLSEKPYRTTDKTDKKEKKAAKISNSGHLEKSRICKFRYIAAFRAEPRANKLTSNGKRKKPTRHWRRAHLRHLANGQVILIPGCWVGEPDGSTKISTTKKIIKLATA